MKREQLEALGRDELMDEAERAGVARPEVLTREEIIDAIEAIDERARGSREGSKHFLSRVRSVVASFVERGLNLPQAAERIRAGGSAPPPAAEPASVPTPTVTLAQIYAAQGHNDRALAVLAQVLASEPGHAGALRLRARLLGQPLPPDEDEDDDSEPPPPVVAPPVTLASPATAPLVPPMKTHSSVDLVAHPAAAASATPAPSTTDAPDAAAAPDAAVAPDADTASLPLRYRPEGCAHEVHTTEGARGNARGDTATFGPAWMPRAVHVTWAADPATTIAVLWSTDAATAASAVEIGESPMRMDRTVVGHVSTSGLAGNRVTVHEVHVCGLRPDTTYHYRVGGPGHWSPAQSFRTAPAPGRADYDVNVVVFGDSRDRVDVWAGLQPRVAQASPMRQPDLALFTGDAVYFGPVQALWDQWFDAARPSMARMPFVLAHGNHEGLAANYLAQFAQPQSDDPERDELYFSFDYGPLHVAVLNDTPRGGELDALVGAQLAWLREDLGRARGNRGRVPWIVVMQHKSLFSASAHVDDADVVFLRERWAPVFDELGVDVVFSGHEHDFEVADGIDGRGEPLAGRRGTTYFTSGGAGAPLYGATPRPWSRHIERVENFLLVRATMGSLEVVPYRADGTVIAEGRRALTPRP